jgi:hypothetical protein
MILFYSLDVNEFSIEKIIQLFNNFSIVSWNLLWNPKSIKQIIFMDRPISNLTVSLDSAHLGLTFPFWRHYDLSVGSYDTRARSNGYSPLDVLVLGFTNSHDPFGMQTLHTHTHTNRFFLHDARIRAMNSWMIVIAARL